MFDAGDAERRNKYPSSEEGGGSSDDDPLPQTRKKKEQKKQESNDVIAFQNEEQGGLYGRKPLNLSQTSEHCLQRDKVFISRSVFTLCLMMERCGVVPLPVSKAPLPRERRQTGGTPSCTARRWRRATARFS